MFDLMLFMVFFGIIIGILSVLVLLWFNKRKKHGRKYGFKKSEFLHPKANEELLKNRRKEHSAEEYK